MREVQTVLLMAILRFREVPCSTRSFYRFLLVCGRRPLHVPSSAIKTNLVRFLLELACRAVSLWGRNTKPYERRGTGVEVISRRGKLSSRRWKADVYLQLILIAKFLPRKGSCEWVAMASLLVGSYRWCEFLPEVREYSESEFQIHFWLSNHTCQLLSSLI